MAANLFNAALLLFQEAPKQGADTGTVRLIAGVALVVIIAVLILRRKKGKDKKQDDDF